jgi:hypothetical protein
MEEARAATKVAVNTYVREKEKSPNVQFIQQLRDKAMSGEANFMLWLGAYDATTIQWMDEAARNVSNTRTALRELLGMTRILRVGVTCMYNVRGRNAASVRRERLQHSQNPTVTAAAIRRMVARAGRPGKRKRAIRELNGRDRETRRYTALPPSMQLVSSGKEREVLKEGELSTDDERGGMCSDNVTDTNAAPLVLLQLKRGCFVAEEGKEEVKCDARKNKTKYKNNREVLRGDVYMEEKEVLRGAVRKRKAQDKNEHDDDDENKAKTTETPELPRCVLRKKIVTECGEPQNCSKEMSSELHTSVRTRESPRLLLRKKIVTQCSVLGSKNTDESINNVLDKNVAHVNSMIEYDDDDDDDVTTNLIYASSLCSSSGAVAQSTAHNESMCDDDDDHDGSVNSSDELKQNKVKVAVVACSVRGAKRKRSNAVTAQSRAGRENKRRCERQRRKEVEAVGTRSILEYYDPVVVPAVVANVALVRSPGGRGDRVGVGTGGGV